MEPLSLFLKIVSIDNRQNLGPAVILIVICDVNNSVLNNICRRLVRALHLPGRTVSIVKLCSPTTYFVVLVLSHKAPKEGTHWD